MIIQNNYCMNPNFKNKLLLSGCKNYIIRVFPSLLHEEFIFLIYRFDEHK